MKPTYYLVVNTTTRTKDESNLELHQVRQAREFVMGEDQTLAEFVTMAAELVDKIVTAQNELIDDLTIYPAGTNTSTIGGGPCLMASLQYAIYHEGVAQDRITHTPFIVPGARVSEFLRYVAELVAAIPADATEVSLVISGVNGPWSHRGIGSQPPGFQSNPLPYPVYPRPYYQSGFTPPHSSGSAPVAEPDTE